MNSVMTPSIIHFANARRIGTHNKQRARLPPPSVESILTYYPTLQTLQRGTGIGQHIQIGVGWTVPEKPRLGWWRSYFRFESILHCSCQPFTIHTFGSMIEEYIRLVTFIRLSTCQEDGYGNTYNSCGLSDRAHLFSHNAGEGGHLVRGIGSPIQVSRLLLLRY